MSKKDLEMKKAEVPEEEPEQDPEEVDETLPEEDEEGEEAPKEKATKGKKKAEVPEEEAPVLTLGDLIEDKRYSLRPKAVAMRAALAAQPLVRTLVPRAEKEAKDATHFYSLNGFCFYVRKGVFQNVPEQVAQLISDTYGQDATILAEHPLNLNNNAAARGEFSR